MYQVCRTMHILVVETVQDIGIQYSDKNSNLSTEKRFGFSFSSLLNVTKYHSVIMHKCIGKQWHA